MRVAEVFNRVQCTGIKERKELLNELVYDIHNDINRVYKEVCEILSIIVYNKKVNTPREVLLFINELIKKLKESRAGRDFIHNLIKYLIRGVDSKLKYIRLNCLVLLRECIDNLNTISEKLWGIVKIKIGEKLFDKEVLVRINAIHIVSRFQEDVLDGKLVFYKLLKDVIRYDPSAEVRRIGVMMIVCNKSTAEGILSRAEDINKGVRMEFVKNKLNMIVWEDISPEKRHRVLQALEEEKEEEIKKIFYQRIESIFEETFKGRYELFVEAFYLQNKNNQALERVLMELMKRYEYADGFNEEFLQTATPAKLFLMRVSLCYIDQERGRDSIELPEISITLKTLIESSLQLTESDCFSGTLSYSLFNLLRYYDLLHSSARSLLLKSTFYILSQEKVIYDVIHSITSVLLMAMADEKTLQRAIEVCKTSRVQAYFLESLITLDQNINIHYPNIFSTITTECTKYLYSTEPEIQQTGIRILVILSTITRNELDAFNILKQIYSDSTLRSDTTYTNHHTEEPFTLTTRTVYRSTNTQQNTPTDYTITKYNSIKELSFCSIVDLSIIFKDNNGIKLWILSVLIKEYSLKVPKDWIDQTSTNYNEEIDSLIRSINHPDNNTFNLTNPNKIHSTIPPTNTIDRAMIKIILSETNTPRTTIYLNTLLNRYYSNECTLDNIQYINIFLMYYFKYNLLSVFSVYDTLIGNIKYWRVFNEQIIEWYKESKLDKRITYSQLLKVSLERLLQSTERILELQTKKDQKEELSKYLDLLNKIDLLQENITTDNTTIIQLLSKLSKITVKILPDNEVLKNLLFTVISQTEQVD
ncbi:hypothetical protein NEOKW01_0966 [Nematocida sp. AWRm80]|nr:hypothetical protein NEOKW01_0966 [Nematocida sp. AWRm80]